MCKYDTIGRVNVEGLRFGVVGTASRWVSNLQTCQRLDVDQRLSGNLTVSDAHTAH